MCGTKDQKDKLTRIALFAEEMRMELDLFGSLGGRGMYVCRHRECVDHFIKLVGKGKIRNTGKYPERTRDRLIESFKKHNRGLNTIEGSSEWPE